MSVIDLDIDAEQLRIAVADVSATQQQAEKALLSTLAKMATWLQAKSIKALSAELGIQQKVIRRRLKKFGLRKRNGGAEITVFYGLNPIALIYLSPKKRAGGIGASGGRYVKGGFIAKGQVFKRRGAARLPIEKQVAEIKDQADVYIEDHLLGTAEFEAKFFQLFEHEIKWRTQTQ